MVMVQIEIDGADLKWLRKEARKCHGGSLQAAALSCVARARARANMQKWLDDEGVPPLTDEEARKLEAELGWKRPPAQKPARKSRRKAA